MRKERNPYVTVQGYVSAGRAFEYSELTALRFGNNLEYEAHIHPHNVELALRTYDSETMPNANHYRGISYASLDFIIRVFVGPAKYYIDEQYELCANEAGGFRFWNRVRDTFFMQCESDELPDDVNEERFENSQGLPTLIRCHMCRTNTQRSSEITKGPGGGRKL